MADQKALNTLAKGAGVVTIGMFLSKFMSYAYRAVIARELGPEAYGQLALGLTVLGIGSVIAKLGFPEGLKKFIPEASTQEDEASYIYSALLVSIPVSIIVGVAIFFSAEFIAYNIFNTENPKALTTIIQLFSIVPLFNVISSAGIASTQAKKYAKYRVITNQIFQNAVQLAFTAGFLLLGFGIVGAAAGWLIGAVLSSFLAFYYLQTRAVPVLSVDNFKNKHQKLYRFSLPLVMTALISTILGWTDTIFLGYFMGDTEVGFYNAALPTAVLMTIPLKALGSLALPSMSEGAQKGKEEVSSILKTLERWTLTLTFPAFILMALFSEEILHLLFGSEFTVAAGALVILSFGYLFNVPTGHMNDIMKTYSRTDILFKNTLAKFILNIPLNIILIGILDMGILGAAIATAGSMILVNSLLLIESQYLLNIHPFSRDLAKPVLSTVLPLLLVYAGLKTIFTTVPLWALIPGSAVFGILYLANLVALNGIKEEDRPIIVGTGRKFGMEREAEKVASLLIR